MSGNQFRISSRWEKRVETPAALGQRMLRSLDDLSAIHPYFSPWWIVDHSHYREDVRDLMAKSVDLGLPLEDVRSRFAEVVAQGVSRFDDLEPDYRSGYWINALNSKARTSKSVDLSIHGGGDRNVASFETADQIFPDPSIVTFPVFKAVLLSLVTNWDPGWAQVSSEELEEHCRPRSGTFDLSWMTYLSAPLAKQISPPSGIVLERTLDGGLLMIAAQETFDASNPVHLEAARKIADAVARLNDT